MPWGMEGPIAALACRCPVRGTSGPRCICAGRFDYPAGTHRTRGQCDRPGGVTREAPRDGSGVHTPTVHRQPPCPWVLRAVSAHLLGARLWCFCRQRPLAARARGLTFVHSDSLPLASCSVYFVPHGHTVTVKNSACDLQLSGCHVLVSPHHIWYLNLRSACAVKLSPLPFR